MSHGRRRAMTTTELAARVAALQTPAATAAPTYPEGVHDCTNRRCYAYGDRVPADHQHHALGKD